MFKKLFSKKDENAPPAAPQPLTFEQKVEKQLGICKFFDFAIANPFDLIYQQKSVDRYKKELVDPLFGYNHPEAELDRGMNYLRDIYEHDDIQGKTKQVLSTAERIAAENRIKSHIQKRISQFSFIFYGIGFAAFLIITAINPAYQTYALIAMLLLSCFGPQLIKMLLSRRWEAFKVQFLPAVTEQEQQTIDVIRHFIQDVLTDIRERLLERKIPLERVNFQLYYDKYQCVQFVRAQTNRQGQPTGVSIYQFEYPEGMGPAKIPATYGKSGIVEDDANDLFILLKQAQFNDEGALVRFTEEYPEKPQYDLPEALLGTSKFENVKEPHLVLPFFKKNTDVKCSCGESVSFDELKTCHSLLHNDFEFYLGIGKKCKKCGKNPFILLNSPGNASIPDGIRKIFE